MLFPSRFRLTAWFAAILVATNALWPLLAQARPANGPPYSVICTAQGLRSLPGEPAGPEQPADAISSQLHCALCSAGGDMQCLPPSAGAALADSGLHSPAMQARGADAATSQAYLSPQPRAPPVVL